MSSMINSWKCALCSARNPEGEAKCRLCKLPHEFHESSSRRRTASSSGLGLNLNNLSRGNGGSGGGGASAGLGALPESRDSFSLSKGRSDYPWSASKAKPESRGGQDHKHTFGDTGNIGRASASVPRPFSATAVPANASSLTHHKPVGSSFTDFAPVKQQRTSGADASGGGGHSGGGAMKPLRAYHEQFRNAPSPGLSLKDRIAQLQKVRDQLDEMAVGSGSSPMSKARLHRSGGGAMNSSHSHNNNISGLFDKRELAALERRVDEEERRAAAGLPKRLGTERRRISELENELEALRQEKVENDQVRKQQRHEIVHLKESFSELRSSMDNLRASVDSMRARCRRHVFFVVIFFYLCLLLVVILHLFAVTVPSPPFPLTLLLCIYRCFFSTQTATSHCCVGAT